MADLVGTCPKTFWQEWIAEGDAAGDPETGQEWAWFTRSRLFHQTKIGDRFYVVAWGKLRGYAIVTDLGTRTGNWWAICRKGGAVACTIDTPIPGFRGLRKRWWNIEDEKSFPDWKTP